VCVLWVVSETVFRGYAAGGVGVVVLSLVGVVSVVVGRYPRTLSLYGVLCLSDVCALRDSEGLC